MTRTNSNMSTELRSQNRRPKIEVGQSTRMKMSADPFEEKDLAQPNKDNINESKSVKATLFPDPDLNFDSLVYCDNDYDSPTTSLVDDIGANVPNTNDVHRLNGVSSADSQSHREYSRSFDRLRSRSGSFFRRLLWNQKPRSNTLAFEKLDSQFRDISFSYESPNITSRHSIASTHQAEHRRKKSAIVYSINLDVLQSMTMGHGEADSFVNVETNRPEVAPESDLEEPCCIICLAKFSEKKPAIQIPCKTKCSLAVVHARCIFEWKERNPNDAKCPLCRSELGDVDYSPPDQLKLSRLCETEFRKSFCINALPYQAGIVRCYMMVSKGKWRSPDHYSFFIQSHTTLRYPQGPIPNENSPLPGDVLLMSASIKANVIRNSKKNSIFLVHPELNTSSKESLVAQIHSSWLGKKHTLSVPKKKLSKSRQTYRESEIMTVSYSNNRTGKYIGPRKMNFACPNLSLVDSPDPSSLFEINALHIGDVLPLQTVAEALNGKPYSMFYNDNDSSASEQDTLENYRAIPHFPKNKSDKLQHVLRSKPSNSKDSDERFILAHNREPYWVESIQSYSLDFQGRASIPSSKNFQLVLDNENESMIMQFGKVLSQSNKTPSIYTIDVKWPLSPLQAFSLGIISCTGKLGVT